MRQSLLALILVVVSALGAVAQDAAPQIRQTIQNQIDAFRADDFDTAFEYASPSIKGMFVTPDNFGLMVRRGYPMVWRPDTVRFAELREVGGRLWQRVFIVDAEGQSHALDYCMIETGAGWKICGVQLLEPPMPTV